MKTLNEQASKILTKLLEMKQTVIDNSGGVFMPIHIEVLSKVGIYRIIALTHFGKQNGDLMRDPEMIILHNTLTGQFILSNYQNDYADIMSNSASIQNDRLVIYNDKIQADHTEIANQWLMNIAEQQGIEL